MLSVAYPCHQPAAASSANATVPIISRAISLSVIPHLVATPVPSAAAKPPEHNTPSASPPCRLPSPISLSTAVVARTKTASHRGRFVSEEHPVLLVLSFRQVTQRV